MVNAWLDSSSAEELRVTLYHKLNMSQQCHTLTKKEKQTQSQDV